MDKEVFREMAKETLKGFPEEKKRIEEEKLHKQLIQSNEWKNAAVIGMTISVGWEVETRPLFEWAWKEGKRTAAPVVEKGNPLLRFYEITSFDDCRKAAFGLIEPDPDTQPPVSLDDLELLVVPGLAYSPDGYRIGYGGGYFDRVLKQTSAHSVSLALSCQQVKAVPREVHDEKVAEVLCP
ncbi:5-formyltetrahydrofolate cyclo-ligase [Alkalicoccus urumqiensis]|uniref:5-formyltetrahydrofolate cyclo-ligase n=1 Tax=Alkalicoccus urumqiensis TaxID=1548213 RepID=A0A2P6MK60_ALKUR|nr:5-formyltetrahydrofolate cyclo-ligase [Alkalicoccus urumqiensis]PRO66674.1 5-formyltetrahydrofolate cyclo-ligase [Alkalicoccus urumqiensis]